MKVFRLTTAFHVNHLPVRRTVALYYEPHHLDAFFRPLHIETISNIFIHHFIIDKPGFLWSLPFIKCCFSLHFIVTLRPPFLGLCDEVYAIGYDCFTFTWYIYYSDILLHMCMLNKAGVIQPNMIVYRTFLFGIICLLKKCYMCQLVTIRIK